MGGRQAKLNDDDGEDDDDPVRKVLMSLRSTNAADVATLGNCSALGAPLR